VKSIAEHEPSTKGGGGGTKYQRGSINNSVTCHLPFNNIKFMASTAQGPIFGKGCQESTKAAEKLSCNVLLGSRVELQSCSGTGKIGSAEYSRSSISGTASSERKPFEREIICAFRLVAQAECAMFSGIILWAGNIREPFLEYYACFRELCAFSFPPVNLSHTFPPKHL
jgi:hypothetical protein